MKFVQKLLTATLLVGGAASVYQVSLYSTDYPGICKRERLSERCNQDQDCCAGHKCDSFGFCVRQR